MYPTSVIALFCDDIREERSGALTLIGVMGDNANLPGLPDESANLVGVIPRLGIYIRINFDVAAELGPITIKVTMPDGTEIDASRIDEETIAAAKSTREKGNQMAGLITRLQFGGLPMKTLGRMSVIVAIGEQVYLAGFLNFISENAANP